MVWAWLAAAVVLAVAEMLTLALAAIFLAAGAGAPAIAAALGGDLLVQAVAFGAVSILGMFAVRPVLLRYRRRHPEEVMPSGAEGMVGEEAVVIDTVKGRHGWGHVRINGESWPAVSRDGSPLHEGEEVVVLGLRHTTLIVGPAARRR